MTQKEITKGNKLIAAFEGAKLINGEGFQKGNVYAEIRDNKGTYLRAENINSYNTDWNWLMAVVERIEHLPIQRDELIGFDYCNLKTLACGKDRKVYNAFFKSETDDTIYSDSTSNTKIKAVWLAVVEFIKFHNENKTLK